MATGLPTGGAGLLLLDNANIHQHPVARGLLLCRRRRNYRPMQTKRACGLPVTDTAADCGAEGCRPRKGVKPRTDMLYAPCCDWPALVLWVFRMALL